MFSMVIGHHNVALAGGLCVYRPTQSSEGSSPCLVYSIDD